MLETIGVKSINDLLVDIPQSLRLRSLQLPAGLSEFETMAEVAALAGRNRVFPDRLTFRGGGVYRRFIPSAVAAVTSKPEFYTAYTPYQAEASQGSLQAFFEYQTLVCELTGLDVSNASLYEGGSAVAESVLMALSINPERHTVVVADSVHPEYRDALATYTANLPVRIRTLRAANGFLDPNELTGEVDDQTLCVIVQHPNFFGHLEEVEARSEEHTS